MFLRFAEFISCNPLCLQKYYLLKLFLLQSFSRNKIHRKVEKKVGNTAFQNIKNLTNHNSNITNLEAAIMKDSVKRMFFKTRQRLVREFNI